MNPPAQETDALARILWDYHLLRQPLRKADALLVLGSHDTRVAEHAAKLFLDGWAPLTIFSGGIGRMTEGWTRPEAEIFAEIAERLGVPRSSMLLETESTNTGENLAFTKRLLEANGRNPRSFILLQKPYMERRAYATFRKHFPDREAVAASPPIPFEAYAAEETAPGGKGALIDIMVGDTQRIPLYGRKGYIVPQDLPATVDAAYRELARRGFNRHLMPE
ncbi:MAG: YdcF family protein [Opitutaceae bacterium]